MEIPNPRRILLLTPPPPNPCLAPLFKVFSPTLRPSHATPILTLSSDGQSAPTSHLEEPSFPATFHITTAYYTARIPLWHSPLPDNIPAWKQEWLDMEGADEVVREIAAWIVGFEKPAPEGSDAENVRNTLKAVQEVVQHHMGEVDPYDEVEPPLLLAVALPGKDAGKGLGADKWDDLCRDCGRWEYIDGCLDEAGKNNEYSETLGLPRIIEALEANEWESGSGQAGGQDERALFPSCPLSLDTLSSDEEIDLPDTGLVDMLEEAGPGLQNPLLGTSKDGAGQKGERAGGGDEVGEEDVAELESLMMRMQAVKEHSANLPLTARKAFAARAVRDIMRSNRSSEA